ncbi:hypothetical protein PENSPDRAFT_620429, partial [Peniophora sp. CONT]
MSTDRANRDNDPTTTSAYMSTPDICERVASALDKVLSKYFEERDELSRASRTKMPPDTSKPDPALDNLFSKYWEERDDLFRAKTSTDKFWGTYLRAMKDEDEARPKYWEGNTGSILTFTGLFAATVGAFLIASYPSLSSNPNDETTMLLKQLLAATTNTSVPVDVPFQVSTNALIVNCLWFCSLLISLACALLATLIQDWSRNYTRDINRRSTLDESVFSRAYNHIYIRMGVNRYGMDEVVEIMVAMIHLSVALFAGGLLLFLFPVNRIVAYCVTSIISFFVLAYCTASLLSVLNTDCPYRTPLTYPPVLIPWLVKYSLNY